MSNQPSPEFVIFNADWDGFLVSTTSAVCTRDEKLFLRLPRGEAEDLVEELNAKGGDFQMRPANACGENPEDC